MKVLRLTFFSVLLALAGRGLVCSAGLCASLTLLTVAVISISCISISLQGSSAYPRGTMCNQLQPRVQITLPGLREPRPRPWSRLPTRVAPWGPSPPPSEAPGHLEDSVHSSPRDGGGQEGGWVDQDTGQSQIPSDRLRFRMVTLWVSFPGRRQPCLLHPHGELDRLGAP